MQFSQELRDDVLAGDITVSFRLWTRPKVKPGGRYPVGPGSALIEVDSIELVPFAEITGGALWTTQDVPFGTNNFNFSPQGGFGVHFLRGADKKQAVTLAGKFLHISNAGIADANSGINASIQFELGYTWFKR